MTDPAASDAIAGVVPVLDAFAYLGVRAIIGGSLASSLHGIQRATMDADPAVALMPSQIRPFLDKIGDDYYTEEDVIRIALQNRTSCNVIHTPTVSKVDLFFPPFVGHDRACLNNAPRNARRSAARRPVSVPVGRRRRFE